MRRLLVSLSTGAVLAVAFGAVRAHTDYLLHDELLCDVAEQLCLRGWLSHNDHNNHIELSARVQRAGVPGTVTITLIGETPGKQQVSTSLTLSVRGDYSEIVSVKIVPQWPFQTQWRVDALHFEARPD